MLITSILSTYLFATELKSPFAEGYWVKIGIEESGVYKLPFDTLRAWGFDDPECIAVYGNGASMPLDLNTSSSQFYYDNILKETPTYNTPKGYHLFYGEGPKNFKNGHFTHHQWDNVSYYFITNHKPTCSIKDSTFIIDTTNNILNQYPYYQDYLQRNACPEIEVDKNYYGESLISNTIKSINFDPAPISKCATLLQLKAISSCENGTLKISYADTDTTIAFPNKSQDYKHTIWIPSSISKIHLMFSSKDDSARLFIHELFTYRKKNLELNNKPIIFSYDNLIADNIKDWILTEGMALKIKMMPNDSAKTWRIENPHNIYSINTNYCNDSFYVPLIKTRYGKYICFKDEICKIPSFIQKIEARDILKHSPINYLIISHSDFKEQAQRLANLRVEKNNFSTLVIDTKDIYNVFSSGMKSPDAIRFFTQYLHKKSDTKGDSLKFIVLFGHGVCNPLLEGQDIYDKIPTYNSGIQGDNIFGVMKTYISPYLAQEKSINVGRLPAITVEDAKILVDKIIQYEYDIGHWKNTFLFTAGKKEQDCERDFFREVDCHAESLYSIDSSLLIKKVYFDNFDNYSKINNILELDINEGVQLVAYNGHSDIKAWEGDVMSIETIKKLENKHLPIFISQSCNYAEFDKKSRCAAEELLLNPQGGAIAVVGGTRSVYGNGYDENTCNQTSSLLYPLLKIKDVNYVSDLVQATNKNGEVLLGDPALRIDIKNEFTFENIEIENEDDNIKITGMISPINISSSFRGFYDIQLLSKPDTIQTQNYLDISQSIIHRNNILNLMQYEGSNPLELNIPFDDFRDAHFLNLYAYNDLGETASQLFRLKRENITNKLNANNPTKHKLIGKQLQGDFSTINSIKVFDMYGKMHFSSTQHHTTEAINLPLDRGIYILILTYKNGSIKSEKIPVH